MKLLILTQAVDEQDPILGFFVRWIQECARHAEEVTVICLRKGTYTLPETVRVYSLGKESGGSRARYVRRFFSLIWRLRSDYDTVFVHMNPEYVLLGWLPWRLTRKKIVLWYNHPHRGLRLTLAARMTDALCYTSPRAASAGFPRAYQMPVGIDTDLFSPQPVPRERRALYLQGRVTPSKHVDLALSALRLVRRQVPDATLTVVGPEDEPYARRLRTEYADLCSEGAVVFMGPRPNQETPRLYSAHGVALNLAAPGHFDKTVLEARACETPVIACSPVVGDPWQVVGGDPEALASAIVRLITLPEKEYTDLQQEGRALVIKAHSLSILGEQLTRVLF